MQDCHIVNWSVSQPPQIWHQRRVFPYPSFQEKGRRAPLFHPLTSEELQTEWLLCFLLKSKPQSYDKDWKPPRAAWFSYQHSLLHFHTVMSVTTLQLLQVQDLRQLRLTLKILQKESIILPHLPLLTGTLCTRAFSFSFFSPTGKNVDFSKIKNTISPKCPVWTRKRNLSSLLFQGQ